MHCIALLAMDDNFLLAEDGGEELFEGFGFLGVVDLVDVSDGDILVVYDSLRVCNQQLCGVICTHQSM